MTCEITQVGDMNMARTFISKTELERVFGGEVSVGKYGIFVVDGGGECLLGNWTTWTGDKAMGKTIVRKKE